MCFFQNVVSVNSKMRLVMPMLNVLILEEDLRATANLVISESQTPLDLMFNAPLILIRLIIQRRFGKYSCRGC